MLGAALITLLTWASAAGVGKAQDAVSPAGAALTEQKGAGNGAYHEALGAGLRAYKSGAWAEARAELERAHAIKATARTWRALGMTAFNLGDYVHAVIELEQSLACEEQPLDATLRAHATELIERARRETARVSLALVPQDARLRVDGAAPLLDANKRLVLTPGSHSLSAEAPGHETAWARLDLLPNTESALALIAHPLVRPAEPATVAPRNGATVGADMRQLRSLRRPFALAALSVGGAALLTASALWLAANRRFSDVEQQCEKMGGCFEAEAKMGAVRRLELTSQVAAGTAAGLLTTALLLWLIPHRF
jgi:hypothetical protein